MIILYKSMMIMDCDVVDSQSFSVGQKPWCKVGVHRKVLSDRGKQQPWTQRPKPSALNLKYRHDPESHTPNLTPQSPISLMILLNILLVVENHRFLWWWWSVLLNLFNTMMTMMMRMAMMMMMMLVICVIACHWKCYNWAAKHCWRSDTTAAMSYVPLASCGSSSASCGV